MLRLVSLASAIALGLAACAPTTQTTSASLLAGPPVPAVYQARTDTGPQGEPVNIPAVRAAYLTERNQRQQVAYNGPEDPGTIIVDPYARVLYYVTAPGVAMRYGVAVGRAGKGYSGTATIRRKQEWPDWRPTDNMIRTEPELYSQFAGGLSGGLDNPLGSRALYLYEGGRDTYYRIHGTMDPSSIGKATSAGCIRMFNQDGMDLFNQVELGTKVKVRSQAESLRIEGPMRETPEGYVQPEGGGMAAADAGVPGATAGGAPTTTVITASGVAPVDSMGFAY